MDGEICTTLYKIDLQVTMAEATQCSERSFLAVKKVADALLEFLLKLQLD